MNRSALESGAFEARYEGGRDPWSFANSDYELERYHSILSSLRRPTYDVVYEAGCAVGVLTAQLASRARRVIATDFAPSAVAQAQERCAPFANVEIACADARSYFPVLPLDLIVFSEIGYYFEPVELTELVRELSRCLAPGGEFVAAHWLGNSEDHVLHGDQVHEILKRTLPLGSPRGARHAGFRIDSWIRS